ncbi:MAG: hypothetical protein ACRD5G_04470, partial [Candidatus Acidiferrales bacterium]
MAIAVRITKFRNCGKSVTLTAYTRLQKEDRREMLKLSGVSKRVVRCIALCTLALLASSSAFAQATTGTISGVVTDPTGATVPG